MTVQLVLSLLAGYLLGSIPFAHLIARGIKGVDLAAVGSGNVGTRNLVRNLGLGWGLLGGALDFGKGWLAMWLGSTVAATSAPWWMLAGAAAVIGHNWPVWLRFRGGRGLAPALGAVAFVALWPELALTFVIGWVLMRLTRSITQTTIFGIAILLALVNFLARPLEISLFILSLAIVMALNALPDLSQSSARLMARKDNMLATLFSDLKAYYVRWLFAAITVTFGLEELRVLFVGFVGYLRDSTGMSSLSLAPIAIGIFALSFLSGPLNRLLGTRRALWLAGGGLVLARVAEQLAQSAPLDLYLSAAATVFFLMWIPLAFGISRARGGEIAMHLGLGVLLGLSLDSALQIGFRTLDLSWQPGILPLLLVLALAALQLWTLSKLAADAPPAADGSWSSSAALLAVGPWLFLQLMLYQNTALYSSLGGWSTPSAGALLLAGNAVGLWMAAQTAQPRRSWVNVAIAGAFTLIPLLLAFRQDALPGIFLWLSQVFSLSLGFFIFLGATRTTGKAGLLRSTLFNGLGQILFVLLTFIYYASYDIDFGLRSGVLPPAAVVLVTVFVAIAYLAKADKAEELTRLYSPAQLAAVLLLVPLGLSLTWKNPAPRPATSDTIRVMDYNLHDAVNTDGRVDPEALARAIEASGADIVGVQEISRGWLIWGGMDMLEWLSQRLDMQYVWGPTADLQWGNAVFTRLPILSVEAGNLPPEDVLLLRGYMKVVLDANGKALTLIDTHFSEKAGQDEIRADQAQVIVDAWGGAPATVIMGDLNSLPDSQALAVMLGSGLIDISREIGQQPTYTYPSFAADHQIDYIFVSPDLGYSDFSIPATTASDHSPLVTTIELP